MNKQHEVLDEVAHEKTATELREEELESLKGTRVEQEALRKAQKYMRKNRAEWKRLHNHAENALFDGNKAQYVYAIKKMRDMLKQPYNDELIETMWITSNQQLKDLFVMASEKYGK
ncbi:protein of unknown function [Pseudotevenvirus RB43]|uniref:Uncharacterized protein a-gt.4 n=2 Tax=Pseudotevenvirus RB43 TaxID=115991 RepID=Q56BZ6_9CAUD|nr:a-gt.4 conserved hypothetical protein [Escherichia phage RB43]AAX78574.1 a-gt.4 conserved hypothetical protein [Escherichia phage RB43]CCK73901.1 protein of unknown function [Pseudotevenvirus RB43]CCL97518.1 protein of unknown function [Pseudotevenvirus RB43]